MKFEFSLDSPIYLQIAGVLEDAIISGELPPGSRLPSVRELAALSRTNPNTVQKALQVLQDKQLIYTRRTSGKFVCEQLNGVHEIREAKAKDIMESCIRDLNALGLGDQEIVELLKRNLDHGSED